MRKFRNLLIALLSLAAISPASVLQTYTDRATWEAASTSLTNVDFESLGLGTGGYTSYGSSTGLTTGGLTFVGVIDPTTFYLYALNPPSGAAEEFGSSTLLRGPEKRTTSYLSVALPATVTSFAVDLMSYDPGAASFRIELDGIDVGIVITTSLRPTRTFFGVTTDAPVSEVRIILDSGNNFFTQGLFDNFAYGSAGAGEGGGETPEIATLVSVGSGLVLLRWAKRRQIAPALPA